MERITISGEPLPFNGAKPVEDIFHRHWPTKANAFPPKEFCTH